MVSGGKHYNRYQPGAVGDGANVVEYEGVRAS